MAAAVGVKAAIIKAMERFDVDPKFVQNVNSAKQARLPWMPGYKPVPEEGNPIQQADAFWEYVHDVAGAPPLVPSLDCDGVDWDLTQTAAYRARFLRCHIDRLIELVGKPPCIYTLDNNWNAHVAPAAKQIGITFDDCTMRIADYRDTPPQDPLRWADWTAIQEPPDAVDGWQTWGAWQFSQAGDGWQLLGQGAPGPVTLNVVKAETWVRWQLAA